MKPPYLDLRRLLLDGRPDDHLVALEDTGPVSWRTLVDRSQCYRKPRGAARRRVLLREVAAVDFLAHLLAALADDDVAVIPPNFQPGTLHSLAELPAPDDVPPAGLELYTSGSTGEPKCVVKTLGQFEAECRVLETLWGTTLEHAVVVATTPYHHIYGLLFRLLWPLCAGRPFDAVTIADPATLRRRLTRFPRTALVASPAQLSRLPDLADLAALAPTPVLVFSSGGPLAPETARRYAAAWDDPPTEILGSTETGGVAWRRQGDAQMGWTPLPGIAVRSDHDGALLVSSPFLATPSPYRMEDAVECEPSGAFFLRGRLDRIVKIEEKRLSLPEMESCLARHPAVTAAALLPIQTGNRSSLGAVVVAEGTGGGGRKALVARLRDHLRQSYDPVLLPRRWRFVDRLPYTDRGKLAVAELAALLNGPP